MLRTRPNRIIRSRLARVAAAARALLPLQPYISQQPASALFERDLDAPRRIAIEKRRSIQECGGLRQEGNKMRLHCFWICWKQ
jgi:hypothetical protein